MSKFKVGDRVRKKHGQYQGYVLGSPYNLPDSVGVVVDCSAGFAQIDFDGCLTPPVDHRSFELVQPASPSPVRTKTVKEIVFGDYGPVVINSSGVEKCVWIHIEDDLNASELSDVINTLTQVRDALADALEA